MPRINNKGVKALRREQAEERQGRYNALSDEEKLDLLTTRRGASEREGRRISRRLHPASEI